MTFFLIVAGIERGPLLAPEPGGWDNRSTTGPLLFSQHAHLSPANRLPPTRGKRSPCSAVDVPARCLVVRASRINAVRSPAAGSGQTRGHSAQTGGRLRVSARSGQRVYGGPSIGALIPRALVWARSAPTGSCRDVAVGHFGGQASLRERRIEQSVGE